jgi:hypothetical protein
MSRKSNGSPKELFLSHSSANAGFANRLAEALAGRGIPTFFSQKSIRGAQEWHDEIGAALQRCDWFLVILTPHSVRSKWVKRELIYALQAKRYNDRIIPLLYKTCDTSQLSWTLSAFQYVDFRKDFEAGYQRLLGVWKMDYRP